MEDVKKQEEEAKAKPFCHIISSKDEELIATPTSPSKNVNFGKRSKQEPYPGRSKRAYKEGLKKKPIEKVNKTGKFVVPCSINKVELQDSLCDKGAYDSC